MGDEMTDERLQRLRRPSEEADRENDEFWARVLTDHPPLRPSTLDSVSDEPYEPR